MPDPIIASVTEPPRTPRPTLYAYLWPDSISDGPPAYELSLARTHTQDNRDPCEILVKIPGELESARSARIEKSRQAVIRLAGDCAGTYAPLRAALDALTAAESERSEHG